MKKEWLLTLVSLLITLVLGAWLTRLFFPQIFGNPINLKLVRESKEVPPFYDVIFNSSDPHADKYLLNDPVVVVRNKPLIPDIGIWGPHDLLGFRNSSVPRLIDVVTIGDSQTYGNNVRFYQNWPNQVPFFLPNKNPFNVYNFSVGGWGPVQYLYALELSLVFQPKVVIVAFYMGNDLLDAFAATFTHERWDPLRVNKRLGIIDYPSIPSFDSKNHQWLVKFQNGIETIFTPSRRLMFNFRDEAVIQEGIQITKNVIKEMAKISKKHRIPIVLTIVPTKETAHGKLFAKEKINLDSKFILLMQNEMENIRELEKEIKMHKNLIFVSSLSLLQEEILNGKQLYLKTFDGHPNEIGYQIIAKNLSSEISPFLKEDLDLGACKVLINDYQREVVLLLGDHTYKIFENEVIGQKNGWNLQKIPEISQRELFSWKYAGIISNVDSNLYGPKAVY